MFLRELREEHRVGDAEFLVDDMGYLITLARTDLTGHYDYSNRNIVEKLFQTYTMRIERFHETWNGSQPALGASSRGQRSGRRMVRSWSHSERSSEKSTPPKSTSRSSAKASAYSM